MVMRTRWIALVREPPSPARHARRRYAPALRAGSARRPSALIAQLQSAEALAKETSTLLRTSVSSVFSVVRSFTSISHHYGSDMPTFRGSALRHLKSVHRIWVLPLHY